MVREGRVVSFLGVAVDPAEAARKSGQADEPTPR